MTTDTSTTQRAQDTAFTAVDEGKHVAGVAASEAKGVAAEAAQQARSVVDDAVGEVRGQLDDQGRQQKDRLAGTLAMFGDDLGRMSETGSGLAADLAQEVADRAHSLSRHLDHREPGELLDDVRRFARQRPGTFLLGALAAGVVAGRLLRSTKDAVEAAELRGTPRVTPASPGSLDVPASYERPTQPPAVGAAVRDVHHQAAFWNRGADGRREILNPAVDRRAQRDQTGVDHRLDARELEQALHRAYACDHHHQQAEHRLGAAPAIPRDQAAAFGLWRDGGDFVVGRIERLESLLQQRRLCPHIQASQPLGNSIAACPDRVVRRRNRWGRLWWRLAGFRRLLLFGSHRKKSSPLSRPRFKKIKIIFRQHAPKPNRS